MKYCWKKSDLLWKSISRAYQFVLIIYLPGEYHQVIEGFLEFQEYLFGRKDDSQVREVVVCRDMEVKIILNSQIRNRNSESDTRLLNEA